MRLDEEDLLGRLLRVLDTAERAVRVLAPEQGAEPDTRVGADKVVSETALLLVAATPAARARPALAARLDELAGCLAPWARGERVRAAMCLRPALALDHAFAHVCLSSLGWLDPSFDRLMARCLEAASAGAQERTPYRMLEREWLGRLWAPARAASGQREAGHERWSALARPLDALSASREHLYAFTHALLYFTDLGERQVRLPRGRASVLLDAEAAVAACLAAQDYDLCGELLLAWPYLRAPHGAISRFALSVLARVEDEAGFLPAPLTRVDRFRALEGDERTRYALTTAYHTVYVMGLLCAAELAHPGPRVRAGLPEGARGAAAALTRHLPEADRGCHWWADFGALPAPEQDALGPMLLTVALERAFERRELGAIRSLLEEAVRLSLVNAPAPRQAAALLERFSDEAWRTGGGPAAPGPAESLDRSRIPSAAAPPRAPP